MAEPAAANLHEVKITPAPTEEEAAAIAAAVVALWPTPQPAGQSTAQTAQTQAWRFSRRWWAASDRASTWGTRPH